MKNNFNLRDYLYNNPLLTEGLDLKASEIEDKDNTSDKEEVEEMSSSKMTKTELKEKIRAEIMATLSEENTMDEAEGEDELDAALDAAEDEIEDDNTSSDEPAGAEPELSDEAGLSDEETAIQADLKKAYDNAVTIGDEKLANQIANTITFFTRAHVVPRTDQ